MTVLIVWVGMLLLLAGCGPAEKLSVTTATSTPAPSLTMSPTASPSPTATPTRRTTFDGDSAYQSVVSQTEFGFRPSGSDAGWATGDWIVAQLQEADWLVETQEFTYLGTRCRNIIGRMPGSNSDPVVLLGAHYDTRRQADQDPHHPEEPVMGANDGASGTAVLIELAHVLEPDKIPYQVWLAFFDAEDNGRLDGWNWIVGSSYMAAQLAVRPEFVIIVDMIGDADQQIFYEHNSDPELMVSIWQIAADLGFGDTVIPEYRHSMLDDHTPFAQLGIPAVDMIDFDYPYWHTTADTADKVSAESLKRVGLTVETFLESGSAIGGSHD